MTVIANSERAYILSEHEAGRTPDEIASALVQRRALAEVLGVLADHATHLSVSATIADQAHFVFVSPPDQEGVRHPLRVAVKDFYAFCREHGLRADEMVKVADGLIDEHRGWTQGAKSAYGCRMTPRAEVLHRQDVEERARLEEKANPRGPLTRMVRRVPDPQAQPPVTAWKPEE